jgi:hypothetical protein
MKQRWYKIEETAQMACPLSVGQAEAGRYTFCINEKCMAWQWFTQNLETKTIYANEEIPDGWVATSEAYQSPNEPNTKDFIVIDIAKKPTRGRCGMVQEMKK